MRTESDSYEVLLARRADALAARAPFLFGHGRKHTVAATYRDRAVVRVEGRAEDAVAIFEGDRLVGLADTPEVHRWLMDRATAVLEGRARTEVFQGVSVGAPPADHVVRAAAFEALTLAPSGFVSEHESVVRARVEPRVSAEILGDGRDPYAFLTSGVLGEDVEATHRTAVVRSASALLDAIESAYNHLVREGGPRPGVGVPPVLLEAGAALPSALAEIARTGRSLLATQVRVKILAEYRLILERQHRRFTLLLHALGSPTRNPP